ncbi:MAG: VanZ family protein [Cyclobacteriaceae bacterium]|nr:VanZ family protein [Cyclobacteriaceae bacterium]
MVKLNQLLLVIIKHSKWLFISWFLIIAILTLLPGSALPHISWTFISIDKTIHIILFAVLVSLGLLGVENNRLKIGPWPKLTIIIGSIGYGYILEYLQSYVPERSYDFADLTADCVGTLVGYGLFLGMTIILSKTG